MSTITTRTVRAGFAESQECVLTDKPQTAIVFKPQIHEGGVRGSIIRYKKDKQGNREQPVSMNFKKLNADEGVEIELNTEAINKLVQRVYELQAILDKTGIRPGINRYRITNADDFIITDQNKARYIKKLLEANLAEDVWEQLVHSNPDIATKLANSKIREDRLASLNQFREMLCNDRIAEGIWQDFFEENTWIFGYGLRYQILRVIQTQPNYGGTAIDGRGGQRGDFLTATEAETKYTCLIEIKKPTTSLLQRSPYRNGAWGISEELAGAVSQVQANCAEWEITGARTDLNREKLTDIHTVSPKGIVVIGATDELNNLSKRNSFERFRREIRNPEIITYDELYERASFIVGVPMSQDTDDYVEDEDDELPF